MPAAAYFPCEISSDGTVHATVEVLYDELLMHCQQMNNRFLIMDVPKGLHGELLLRWVRQYRKKEPAIRSMAPFIIHG